MKIQEVTIASEKQTITREILEVLEKYVKSLFKSELQIQLLDALVRLDERRHYW